MAKGQPEISEFQPIFDDMLNRGLGKIKVVNALNMFADLLCSDLTPQPGEILKMPFMDQVPDYREWVGDRVGHEIGGSHAEYHPRVYELTLQVLKEYMRWDKLNLYQPQFDQVAIRTQLRKKQRVKGEMGTATSKAGYDGKPVFATDHPVGSGVESNLDAGGSGRSWILACCDTPGIAPFWYKLEYGPDWVVKSAATDEPVFNQRLIKMGAELWDYCEPGIWQTVYASDQAITDVNISDAEAVMADRLNEFGLEYNYAATHIFYSPKDWLAVARAIDADYVFNVIPGVTPTATEFIGGTNVLRGRLIGIPIQNLDSLLSL